MAFMGAFALLCAYQLNGVFGSDVAPDCTRAEFSDSGIDETALVQTKIQEHRRQTLLAHGQLRGLASLADAVTAAAGSVKNAAETQDASSYVSGFVTSAIIMAIFAYFYNKHIIDGAPPFPKVDRITGPRQGLFDCFCDLDTCLHVTFCMPVVAAKNYHAADVVSFWPGCIVAFVSTYSPIWFVSVIIRTILSGRVQEKLGLESSCFWNCIMATCCLPCDVGRESLEIDQEVGAEIKCCCTASYKARGGAEVQN